MRQSLPCLNLFRVPVLFLTIQGCMDGNIEEATKRIAELYGMGYSAVDICSTFFRCAMLSFNALLVAACAFAAHCSRSLSRLSLVTVTSNPSGLSHTYRSVWRCLGFPLSRIARLFALLVLHVGLALTMYY